MNKEQYKKLIKKGLWTEERRLKSCMKICEKMGINMVNVEGLRFILKNSGGEIIGFKKSKDIKELLSFLLSHDYADGNFVKKKNKEKIKE